MSTATSSKGRPVNIVNGTHSELIAWLILNVWTSHFGLPALLAIVICSKKIHRDPTFLNLCIAFILIGISSTLLLYSGHITGEEPPVMLCLLQASLLYGMPALSSTAVFALVFQMWVVVRATYRGQGPKEGGFVQRWLLLTIPYVAWIICILATAVVGAQNPHNVSRSRRFFYCSVDALPLTNTLTVSAAIILFVTLIFEGWTLLLFYKLWKATKRGGGRALELAMPMRTVAFGLYVMIALSTSLISVKSPQSPVPDMIIASAASFVILIFGTQKDILRVVAFWRKESPTIVPNKYYS